MAIWFSVAGAAYAQTAKTVVTFVDEPRQIPDGGLLVVTPNVNISGVIYHVSVTLVLSHDTPPDLDILLYAPGSGSPAVMLMSDVGSSFLPWLARRFEIDDCARRTFDAVLLLEGPVSANQCGRRRRILLSRDAFRCARIAVLVHWHVPEWGLGRGHC